MDKKVDKSGGQNKKDFPLLNYNHLRRFSVVITTTLFIVLIFVGTGIWLDMKLGTKPWLLIALTLASFPVMQLVVYKKMKDFTKKEFKRLNIKEKK